MFAFAGLRKRFRSFQINRNDGAGLGIFRSKVAPAVGLDFVGPRCEARAIQLQRPGLAGEPHIKLGGGRGVLCAGRSTPERQKNQYDKEMRFHADLRRKYPSIHTTPQYAIAEESKILFIELRNILSRWDRVFGEESMAGEFRGRRELCNCRWVAPFGSSRSCT